jgi:hypothetical protein
MHVMEGRTCCLQVSMLDVRFAAHSRAVCTRKGMPYNGRYHPAPGLVMFMLQYVLIPLRFAAGPGPDQQRPGIEGFLEEILTSAGVSDVAKVIKTRVHGQTLLLENPSKEPNAAAALKRWGTGPSLRRCGTLTLTPAVARSKRTSVARGQLNVTVPCARHPDSGCIALHSAHHPPAHLCKAST